MLCNNYWRECVLSIGKFQAFLRANGFYYFATRLAESPLEKVRNWLLAREFGVKKIHIPPGAHLRGLSSIEMGEDFSAEDGLWLEAITKYNDQQFLPRIIIGNHVRVSRWVHIAATHHVEIGDRVLLGSKVIVTDHNHGHYSREHTSPYIAPSLRPLDDDQRVVIGRNVWLGDGVVVTPNSSIGEGSVIGANSVVRGCIPPFTIAAGAPARTLKVFNFDTQTWGDSK
jgi:lipopolysaccharide O-acetyltransferase